MDCAVMKSQSDRCAGGCVLAGSSNVARASRHSRIPQNSWSAEHAGTKVCPLEQGFYTAVRSIVRRIETRILYHASFLLVLSMRSEATNFGTDAVTTAREETGSGYCIVGPTWLQGSWSKRLAAQPFRARPKSSCKAVTHTLSRGAENSNAAN